MNVTRLAAVVSRTDTEPCRLCGGRTEFRFTRRVLDRWAVGYRQCVSCGSLQTDAPHWLDIAYADPRPVLDTGMVARTLRMAQVVGLVLRVAGVRGDGACLDWGGGNGLFARIMRDQGYDFVSHDSLAEPYYTVGFTAEILSGRRFDVVTSFEVFEHLAHPGIELAQILALQPSLWIFSTQLYRGQDGHWPYLAPDTGRHVFFFSEAALHAFAERSGFIFIAGRDVHAFVRAADHGSLTLRSVRYVIRGGKLAGFASAVNFLARQRRTHRRWLADRETVRGEARLP